MENFRAYLQNDFWRPLKIRGQSDLSHKQAMEIVNVALSA